MNTILFSVLSVSPWAACVKSMFPFKTFQQSQQKRDQAEPCLLSLNYEVGSLMRKPSQFHVHILSLAVSRTVPSLDILIPRFPLFIISAPKSPPNVKQHVSPTYSHLRLALIPEESQLKTQDASSPIFAPPSHPDLIISQNNLSSLALKRRGALPGHHSTRS